MVQTVQSLAAPLVLWHLKVVSAEPMVTQVLMWLPAVDQEHMDLAAAQVEITV
jgi:hypothetical protein